MKIKLTGLCLVLACATAKADTTTPNMSLQLNPNWPSDLQSNFQIIDNHNHTAGQGVLVPVSGINIQASLPFNGQAATHVGSLQLTDGGAGPSVPLSFWTDGTNFWLEDGQGNLIQVTSNGQLTNSTSPVPGYVNGNLSVDGGVTLVRLGSCFTTSYGAIFCDDSSGDATITAVLGHNITLRDGNDTATVWFQANSMGGPAFLVDGGLAVLNGNSLDLYDTGNGAVGTITATSSTGLAVSPPGGASGTTSVTGQLNVSKDTAIDGGLNVWNFSRFQSNLEVGVSDSYSTQLSGNSAIGGSVNTAGAQILSNSWGNVLIASVNGGPSCSDAGIAACFGETACVVATSSTDTAGVFTIGTGSSTTSCAVNSSLATITFEHAFNNIPAVIVQVAGDSDAGAAPVLPAVFAQNDAGAFVLSTTTAFTPNTLSNYTFSFHTFGFTDGGF